jgi:hypothetical protein
LVAAIPTPSTASKASPALVRTIVVAGAKRRSVMMQPFGELWLTVPSCHHAEARKHDIL